MAQRLHRNWGNAFMSFLSFLFRTIGGPDSLLHWCLHRFRGMGGCKLCKIFNSNVSEKRWSFHWVFIRSAQGEGAGNVFILLLIITSIIVIIFIIIGHFACTHIYPSFHLTQVHIWQSFGVILPCAGKAWPCEGPSFSEGLFSNMLAFCERANASNIRTNSQSYILQCTDKVPRKNVSTTIYL